MYGDPLLGMGIAAIYQVEDGTAEPSPRLGEPGPELTVMGGIDDLQTAAVSKQHRA